MSAWAPTALCVHRENLLALNVELDDVNHKISGVEGELSELRRQVRSQSQMFLIQITELSQRIEILSYKNRITEQFKGGDLFSGFSPIMRGFCFLTHTIFLFQDEPIERLRQEIMTAQSVIKQTMPNKPLSLPDLVQCSISDVKAENLELMAFSSEPTDGPFSLILSRSMERRRLDLDVTDSFLEELIQISFSLYNPAMTKFPQIIRPLELIELLTQEYFFSYFPEMFVKICLKK